MQLYMYWQMYSNFPLGEWTACTTIFYYPATQASIHCLQNFTHWLAEVLLYIHWNRRFIRDGSPGRPPRLSHSSWTLHIIHQLVNIMYYANAHWNIYMHSNFPHGEWIACVTIFCYLQHTLQHVHSSSSSSINIRYSSQYYLLSGQLHSVFGEGQCIK